MADTPTVATANPVKLREKAPNAGIYYPLHAAQLKPVVEKVTPNPNNDRVKERVMAENEQGKNKHSFIPGSSDVPLAVEHFGGNPNNVKVAARLRGIDVPTAVTTIPEITVHHQAFLMSRGEQFASVASTIGAVKAYVASMTANNAAAFYAAAAKWQPTNTPMDDTNVVAQGIAILRAKADAKVPMAPQVNASSPATPAIAPVAPVAPAVTAGSAAPPAVPEAPKPVPVVSTPAPASWTPPAGK